MPLFDFRCEQCETVSEHMAEADERTRQCEDCGGIMNRLLSWRDSNVLREEAPWIRTVLDVVAKDSDKPETKDFLKNPTRSNMKRWMKSEGIRHAEPGEFSEARRYRQENERRFEKQQADRMMERLQERRRIDIR
ncbi:MAG: zinc ribbon domain-containing protein [Desulfobacteraceae bacterium]